MRRGNAYYLAAVCVLAAVRVFLGAAAMPPFNDADETDHFDLIHKFARGYWPNQKIETWDVDTARLLILYGSSEFQDQPRGPFLKPAWSWPRGQLKDKVVTEGTEYYRRHYCYESHSPPVYYALGAAWYRLGSLLRLSPGHLFYWVRFMDVPIAVGLVVVTFFFCTAYAPRILYAAPLLVACTPSPTFYSITGDVLSPLAALLAVYALLRWDERRTLGWSVGGGLLVAAAVLVKLTNVVILVVLAVVLARRGYLTWRESRPRREWLALLLVGLCAALPLGAWGTRNRVLFGDWSGNEEKVRHLGWTRKPLGALLDHPLFTLSGQREYWNRLLVSSWRGDINWAVTPVESQALNVVLMCFSVLLFAAGALAALTGWGAALKQFPAVLLLVCVVLSVLTLMVLSTLFDFGDCVYPSRAFPYFANARLISGCLGPFLILAAAGAEVIARGRALLRWALVGAYCLLLLASYVLLVEPMSASLFNWFHLAGGV
jgi:hypothetical protein